MAKLMNWQNLRLMFCPYCESELNEDIEVRCVKCRFHIDKERFKSIVEHRGFPDKKIQRLRWQNLRDEKCPACENFLTKQNEAKDFEVLKCVNPECTFKIREDKYMEILEDKAHPINRFYKKNVRN